MIIFALIFLLVLIIALFWQGALLWATLTGSPIVYANKNAVRDTLKLANIKKGELVVDLGCGNAQSLIMATKEFGARGLGVDRSLYSYLKSKLNVFLSGQSKNIEIVLGDFQKIEKKLKSADVIYLYLLNETLVQIEPWFFDHIGDKTRVVSLAFWFPRHEPVAETETFNLGKITKARLYCK
ncbi:MAG: hypothetical protein WC107_06355 [Patescibacteria group bacterium]